MESGRGGKPLSKSPLIRRFVARYIAYLEVFGFLFVATMAIVIAVLWVWQVDDVAQAYQNPLIKPYEHVVIHPANVVVLKMLLPNHAEVIEGQPIAEICNDPAWVSRYAAAQQATALALTLDSNQMKGAWTHGEETLRVLLQKASAHWEEQRAAMPKVNLLAPHSGVVTVDKRKEGTVVLAGKEIAEIIDFGDLRISGDFRGTNQAYARVGQPIKVEILMTYGSETLLSTIEQPGKWLSGSGQFNSAAEGTVKNILNQYFANKLVTMEDDTTFAVSKVTGVELLSTLQTEETRSSTGQNEIEPEPFADMEITGRVIEGTHEASVRTLGLPESVYAEVKQALLTRFEGRPIRIGETPLYVTGMEDLKAIVTMDVENTDVEKTTTETGEPILMEKVERKFIFTAKIENASPALVAKVRELALSEPPSYIKTKTVVVVGTRRVAMLLFRKN